MADFSALKSTIQTYIKQNGNEEITGNILQEILLAMVQTMGDSAINGLVSSLSNEATTRANADTTLSNGITAINNAIQNGYVYAGIATPTGTPVSGKVFYVAIQAGTYTNFGGLTVAYGINILKYNGSAWSLDVIMGIDAEPTAGSVKPVQSGGVFDEIASAGVYDVSAKNSGETFASLAALLSDADLNTLIPTAVRKGGMTIRFVQTYDNTYVQYRYLGTAVTGTPNPFLSTENWERDDINSLNRDVEGTFTKQLTWDRGYVSTAGVIKTSTGSVFSQPFLLKKGERVTVTTNNRSVAIICSTASDSVSLDDTLTVIQTTSSTSQEETHVYTATDDIKIVLCVTALNYSLSFYNTRSFVDMRNNMDDVPTEGSDNFVKSGGVYSKLNELSNAIGVETIIPTLIYSDGVGKYISTLGVIKTNASYHYSDAIQVKRNDVLIVDGRGGQDYCCLALQAATGVFTPLVNYWDINHNYFVHFLYVVKEDCNIVISSTTGYDSITILRGIDERTVELQSNIFTIPADNVLVNESLLNPGECLDNAKLDSSGSAPILSDSSYWITNFIPVDESTNWLFVNYSYPTRIVRYDADKQFESFVGSPAIPAAIDMFNHPTVKYVRMVFAKSLVSFEDRYKVRITKSTDGQSSSKANKQIDGSIVGIRNNAYVTNKDIAKFEADKVYGTYISTTVFNVDGEAVELDTTSVYIDISTKRQYRYDGTGLYDVGYYDDKSLIFTESFTVDIPRTDLSAQNLIVTANAKYYQGSGVTDKPMIQLLNFTANDLLNGTIKYVIGGDRGFKQKEWRAQILNYQQYNTKVNITVPAGVTLFIDKFSNFYSDKKGYETFPRVNAHAFAAPDNTIMYMEQNAKLGFACMITIPKRTYDGVWVCFHDDDKITRYARHEDGSALTNADLPQNAPGTITSIEDCPIGYFTYEELMQFDFGIYYSYERFKANRGQKIPLLKDFFMICAKTGIHPMLSVHPNWTESEWLEIKAMTDKLSLTEKLNLKFAGGEDFFGTTYPVFGDEIESYAIDVSTSRDAAESMASLIETLGIDLSKVRVGIEYFRDVITTTKVNNAIANGMFAAMVMDGAITSEDYEYWMEHGVSEFTDDNHTSVGLNW